MRADLTLTATRLSSHTRSSRSRRREDGGLWLGSSSGHSGLSVMVSTAASRDMLFTSCHPPLIPSWARTDLQHTMTRSCTTFVVPLASASCLPRAMTHGTPPRVDDTGSPVEACLHWCRFRTTCASGECGVTNREYSCPSIGTAEQWQATLTRTQARMVRLRPGGHAQHVHCRAHDIHCATRTAFWLAIPRLPPGCAVGVRPG